MTDVDPHKHPSSSTRFQKGQSGNPAGRPSKPRPPSPLSAFDVVLERTLAITQDGERREVSVDEALRRKTVQDAFAGKRAARRELMRMVEEREARRASHQDLTPRLKVIEKIEHEDPANAEGALLLLGIADHDPRMSKTDSRDGLRLLLEPWAVQAALKRRGLAPLTRDDVADVNRCTRDAATLVWPRGKIP